MFQETVNAIDPYIKPTVCSNIVITGGSSLFEGMFDRLKRGISSMLDPSYNSVIWHAQDDQFYLKKMANLSKRAEFVDSVVTRKKFDEYGSLALIEMLRL